MTISGILFLSCIADEVGGIYLINEGADSLHAVSNRATDIMFNAGGTWTARSSESWLEPMPSSGEGGRNIVTVRTTEQNRTKQPRKAQVIITSDGKSKTVEVVQRGDYAFFAASEYQVAAEGGIVDIAFSTNVPKGTLYISYTKYDWYVIGDSVAKNTRTEEWSGKIKPITVEPNEEPMPRATKFMLGIYDKRKSFMVLDSTWVRQAAASAP